MSERERQTQRRRDREKLEEDALLFFISAHTSNKDIHHTHSHPPLHFLPLWTSYCVFSSDRESSVSARSCANYDVLLHINDQKKITLRKKQQERCMNETLSAFQSLDFVSCQTCSGISNLSWWQMEETTVALTHPVATHTLKPPLNTLHILCCYIL